jgi:hypothetical protein
MRAPLVHRVSTQVVVQFGIGVVVIIVLQFTWVTIRGSYGLTLDATIWPTWAPGAHMRSAERVTLAMMR